MSLRSGVPVVRDARLDSWKAIASHLGRTVRTVQRWERYEGLPVRRLLHHTLSSVYAYVSDLDAWMAERDPILAIRQTIDRGNGDESVPAPAETFSRREDGIYRDALLRRFEPIV